MLGLLLKALLLKGLLLKGLLLKGLLLKGLLLKALLLKGLLLKGLLLKGLLLKGLLLKGLLLKGLLLKGLLLKALLLKGLLLKALLLKGLLLKGLLLKGLLLKGLLHPKLALLTWHPPPAGQNTLRQHKIMDNLFGRCGVGSAPPGTLVSTPLFPTASQPPTTLPCASEGQPGPSMTLPTTQPRSIRSRVSHPSFYDLYEAHSERRTSALETLVRPEQERRRRLKERKRRRFEAKMLTAMGEVVSQLKCIGSQQERIIELLQDKPNMP
ncbi:uncharacterized protein LOC117560279 isoform X3 [Gymnodraco acuticeps]|uniref:Uncharacterized protein LOC117560279 isoform X3 n=1 Tax=Gymnodraco acuticeps TaxID=8218 RepID=A0A6P8VQL0_GYMAC|nr:uncharacterized protein LOC117560279 isoform X3 [Gymnodraco acuticeps]